MPQADASVGKSAILPAAVGLLVAAALLWFFRGSYSPDANIITCSDGLRETVQLTDFVAEYAPVSAGFESRAGETPRT